MDADPWADAPPSPRPQTPSSNVVSPSHPSYPVISSPLAGVSVSHSQSPSSPLASSDSTANDHPIAQPQESNIEIEEGSDAVEASGGDKDVIEGAEGDVNGNDGFDDFDDFDEPAAGPSSPQPGDDDGFGDFGDFEEGEFGDVQDVQDVPANQKVMVSEPDPTEQPWVSRAMMNGYLVLVIDDSCRLASVETTTHALCPRITRTAVKPLIPPDHYFFWITNGRTTSTNWGIEPGHGYRIKVCRIGSITSRLVYTFAFCLCRLVKGSAECE